MSEVFSLKAEGLEDALLMFNPKLSDAISKQSVFDVYAKGDQLVANELQQRIYSKHGGIKSITETDKGTKIRYHARSSYKRTGRARRGRYNRETAKVNMYVRIIYYDSMLAGAEKNYTPYLNRNSRVKILNTHFWDVAMETLKLNTRDIINDSIKKVIAKKNRDNIDENSTNQ